MKIKKKENYSMSNMSDFNDVMNVSAELSNIAKGFYFAISNECMVELRIEDLPHMKMDTQLKTRLQEVKINEDRKVLYIDAADLSIVFEYDTTEMGSSSCDHEKFYFQSENASLTVKIFK